MILWSISTNSGEITRNTRSCRRRNLGWRWCRTCSPSRRVDWVSHRRLDFCTSSLENARSALMAYFACQQHYCPGFVGREIIKHHNLAGVENSQWSSLGLSWCFSAVKRVTHDIRTISQNKASKKCMNWWLFVWNNEGVKHGTNLVLASFVFSSIVLTDPIVSSCSGRGSVEFKSSSGIWLDFSMLARKSMVVAALDISDFPETQMNSINPQILFSFWTLNNNILNSFPGNYIRNGNGRVKQIVLMGCHVRRSIYKHKANKPPNLFSYI